MERGRLPGIAKNELFYADDTACFSTQRDLLEATLRTMERISASYGLRLNNTKGELLTFNTIEPVSFEDGAP
eukprot:12936515-Prorocentrum_lima.AAC.1